MRCHRRLHFTRFFQTAFLELRIQFLDFYCFVFRGGVGYFEKYEKYRAFPAFRKVHSAKAVSPLFAFNDAGFHVPFQHPVLFPLYFVPRTLPRQCFIVVFVVGNLLYLSQIAYMAPLISEGGRLLGGKYAALTGAYLNSDLYAQARGISIGYLERTLTFVLVVLFYKKLNTREHAVFLNMFLVYLFINLWMSEITILVDRIGLLFLLSYLVLWPAVARCFTLKSNRMLFVGGIMIYSLIRVSICSNNILYRYDNVLLTGSNYPERMYIMDRYKDQLLNSN